MNIKLFMLINLFFKSGAISIKQPKFIKIDTCNCSVSRWYVNQSYRLKRYLLNNKEALYM